MLHLGLKLASESQNATFCQWIASTTLPVTARDSRSWWPVATSSSGKTRSTTASSRPCSTRGRTRHNSALLPIVDPRSDKFLKNNMRRLVGASWPLVEPQRTSCRARQTADAAVPGVPIRRDRHDVDAAFAVSAGSRLRNRFAIQDRLFGAERAHALTLSRLPTVVKTAGAEQPGDLQRGAADAAGAGVHEDRLAGLVRAPVTAMCQAVRNRAERRAATKEISGPIGMTCGHRHDYPLWRSCRYGARPMA